MVNGNELGNAGFQYLGVPYSRMDCQAFVEQCLRDCGMDKNLAGSNAWYREVNAHGAIMSPEECVKQLGCVPEGAFLFIHAYDGGEPAKYHGDGLGNASHIGICTGTRGEGAIASSASRGCVAESKFKGKTINGGWNKVGLWDQVAYDYGGGTEPIPGPQPDPGPTPEITAIVGNVPAGNRQDVNLRAKASTTSRRLERIECGQTVEVLKYGTEWCKVRWRNTTGYMMTQFLIFEDDDTQGNTYTVIIPNLTLEEADELIRQYPGAEKKEERG